MSEPLEDRGDKTAGRLALAIREVKNAVADRDDVVVDIREAQLTRLELLAEDLASVAKEIPQDDDRFDFALSSGIQPRLWVDAVSHVTMGRDRRTYRFLRDTRLGRVVLAETPDIKTIADQVTRYVAERVIERRKVLEGDVAFIGMETQVGAEATQSSAIAPARSASVARGVSIALLGALLGFLVFALLSWERLAAILSAS